MRQKSEAHASVYRCYQNTRQSCLLTLASRRTQRFHDENQVPIHEGSISQGMALASVEQRIGDGATKNGNVGERNGVLGGEFHDQDVNGHENATPANASAGLIARANEGHLEGETTTNTTRYALHVTKPNHAHESNLPQS